MASFSSPPSPSPPSSSSSMENPRSKPSTPLSSPRSPLNISTPPRVWSISHCTPAAASQPRALSYSGSSCPPSPIAARRNVLRYEAGMPRRVLFQEDSPQTVSPINSEGPRTVPRSPLEVLDAPDLIPVVDWMADNVLAAGSGNCFSLWNACSSKEEEEEMEKRYLQSTMASSSCSPSPSSFSMETPRSIPQPASSVTASLRDSAREDFGSGSYSALHRSMMFSPCTPDAASQQRVFSSSGTSSSSTSCPPSPFAATRRKIFRYKPGIPGVTRRILFDEDSLQTVSSSISKGTRKVPQSSFKVLYAPALQDDFSLNLLDWSPHNLLAVGLGNRVYLWNACSSKVTKLCDLGAEDSVCSVGWAQEGNYLAVGTNLGKVQIWDASTCKRVRIMESHELCVGAIAWSLSLLSSGSRDKTILHYDMRAQDDYISKLTGHESEVCGLKWSYDNRELASGGNDNRLFVWNEQSTQPILKYFEHTGAVKAIAWSPHMRGLLASGGGAADRCIRFWNTTTDTHLSCMDTGSQVCNLVWSKNVNELVSTHGYSQNQIIVWRYPTMSKLATLTGHTYRVLYLAISPDGQTIVTGAGDETLRFWNAFPCPKSQRTDNLNTIGGTSYVRTYIR